MLQRYFKIFKDPVWLRVITLSLTLFFVMLADALISFWAPNLIQDKLGSAVLMGMIISFQSVVGLGADIIFPQILRMVTVKKFVLLAIVASIATSLALLSSAARPFIAIFLLAMALWGVYYEFLAFGSHQFVADVIPLKERPGAWGILGVFKNLAYFLGPMLGAWILIYGEKTPAYLAILLALVALIVLFVSGKTHDRPMTIDISQVNLVAEIKHWLTLFVHVWPMIILSLFLGFIDATFWTIGAVLTERLARENFWGSLFLPMYALPSLFMGFVVAKWGIYTGKKRLAEIFLFIAGLFLLFIGAVNSIFWQLGMVFLSSAALSITYPLVDGVYSDIVARLGRERKHMIGLTSSVTNLSYIVWPIIAGFLAVRIGEKMVFTVMGGLTLIVAVFLLLTTPRKLKLPEIEIKTWE